MRNVFSKTIKKDENYKIRLTIDNFTFLLADLTVLKKDLRGRRR